MSAANFAPYQPSPDERQRELAASTAAAGGRTTGATPASSANRSPQYDTGDDIQHAAHKGSDLEKQPMLGDGSRRDSLDSDYDARYATESYQSSGPQRHATLGTTAAASLPAWAQQEVQRPYEPVPRQSRWQQTSMSSTPGDVHLSYTTSQGWNLSNLCFAAWGLPPFSSVLMLIYETENDLVRFHAYQAGMLGICGVTLLWILRSWLGWTSFSIVVGMAMLGYSWVCGSNAANAAPTLARTPYLAFFGPLAEQWVGEE